VDQIVGQVIVDFAVRQVAAIFTQLDEHFQAVAPGFLLFRRHLAACGYIFVGLAALAATLGQRLELGDDFGVAVVVIAVIGRVVIGVLGGASGTSACRRRARSCLGRTLGGLLGISGAGCLGCRLGGFSGGLAGGFSCLGCRLGSLLGGRRSLCTFRRLDRGLCGGLLGRCLLGRRLFGGRLGVSSLHCLDAGPGFHCCLVDTFRRRNSLRFFNSVVRCQGGLTSNLGHRRFRRRIKTRPAK